MRAEREKGGEGIGAGAAGDLSEGSIHIRAMLRSSEGGRRERRLRCEDGLKAAADNEQNEPMNQ
jgi:hypothetical protein